MARLRILSTNLLVDRVDPAALSSVLTDTNPDIVTCQELGPKGTSVINAHLPHGRLAPSDDLFGMGIATRHPTAVEPLELSTRSGWAATLDPARWPDLDQPVDIVNLHLLNPLQWPWKASQRVRREQIAGAAAYLDGRDAASVVVGDMNTSPMWPEYALLTELGDDAARETDTEARTWAHLRFGPRWIRIDHAFVSGATPLTTRTISIAGTDHAALLIDIEV